MHGTVILVAADHAASISAVLGELAAARAELRADGVSLDVLVVDAGSTDGSIETAGRAADELGLSFDVVVSEGSTAWTSRRSRNRAKNPWVRSRACSDRWPWRRTNP